MGIGRIAYEDWDEIEIPQMMYYEFQSTENEACYRIGLVTNLELASLISPIACSLSTDDLKLLRKFTDIVHENLFGCRAPETQFSLFFAISKNSIIDMAKIKSMVNFTPRLFLDKEPGATVPFIAYSTTSKSHHLVTEVLRRSPVTYHMDVKKWKGGLQSGDTPSSEDTSLASYYKTKYGITVHSNQPILMSKLGNPFKAHSLTGGLSESRKVKEGDKSILYLVPQLCCLSPLTDIRQCVAYLPEFLFWITSGLIAKKVLTELGVPIMIKKSGLAVAPEVLRMDDHVVDFLIPCTFRRYRSDVISLAVIALTCPGANLPYNYDHLEWVGDAVWRVVACHEAVIKPKIAPHMSSIMSNDRMGSLCASHFSLLHEQSVLSLPPSPKNPQLCRPKLRNFRILANIVEALLAVCYITGGTRCALVGARKMGILEISDLKDMEAKPTNMASVGRLEQSLRILRIANKNVRVGELEKMRSLVDM